MPRRRPAGGPARLDPRRPRRRARWTHLTPSELAAALDRAGGPAGDQPLIYKAPHFTWQVRRQLEQILGPADAVETGGYRVITTLDWHAQQLAEQWLTAAADRAEPAAQAPATRC